LAHSAYQLISANLIDRHILCTEVVAQRLGQTQRHPAGLAVDHQRRHPRPAQPISRPLGPVDCVEPMSGPAVSDEDE
jgi:hypothetical protein